MNQSFTLNAWDKNTGAGSVQWKSDHGALVNFTGLFENKTGRDLPNGTFGGFMPRNGSATLISISVRLC